MKKSALIPIALVLLVAASPLLAARPATAPGVDPTIPIDLEGSVVAFTAAAGLGMPILVVDDAALGETAVRLAPFWFLTGLDFTAAGGDEVAVVAYTCNACGVYVAATVHNLTTGVSVELRDALGLPVWQNVQGRGPGAAAGNAKPGNGKPGNGKPGNGNGPGTFGPGHGPGDCTGLGLGPDMSAVATATGLVVGFSGGPGEGTPLLVLDVAGDEMVFFAGPFRAWIDAGFVPTAGQTLDVVYAPADQGGEVHLVAITIIDPATGFTLSLRDPETGLPLVGRATGRPW